MIGGKCRVIIHALMKKFIAKITSNCIQQKNKNYLLNYPDFKYLNNIIECMQESQNIFYSLADLVNDAKYQYMEKIANIKNEEIDKLCTMPAITYDAFFDIVKHKWEGKIATFVTNSSMDTTIMQYVIMLYELLKTQLQPSSDNNNDSRIIGTILKLIARKQYNAIIISPILRDNLYIVLLLIALSFPTTTPNFENLEAKLIEKTDNEIMNTLTDIARMLEFALMRKGELTANIGVDSELDKIIPDSFGPLKAFYVKIISKYYKNLHPIVWVNIVQNLIYDIKRDVPVTSVDMFKIISKNVLLNSGPFVLKILQQIVPFVDTATAEKYNIRKLAYPLMATPEVNVMLKGALEEQFPFEHLIISRNISASVGHVCIVQHNDMHFIIKIIKPLSIIQSCWEYKVLFDVYEPNTCEHEYVTNVLLSNAEEMNAHNEIHNIKVGHECYTMNYMEHLYPPLSYIPSALQGYLTTTLDGKIDARLTTIQVVPSIIKQNCWYALAMTIAKGVPLIKLIEGNLLENDTKYRARLHRCFDVLTYSFFYNLIAKQFCHGDLHAGNIFFSYDDNLMTLIDFGSVINFTVGDDINNIVDILLMAVFYNYGDLLDSLTDIVNSNCKSDKTKINKDDDDYVNLRSELEKFADSNTASYLINKAYVSEYEKNHIISKKRIEHENDTTKKSSMYDDLIVPVVDNTKIRDNITVLPKQQHINVEGITFGEILQIIMKFYTTKGINLMVRLGDIFAFQKAYSLLYGVIVQINYDYTRFTLMVQRALIQLGHILQNKVLTAHILSVRRSESKKFAIRVTKVENPSEKHDSIEKLDPYMVLEKYLGGSRNTYKQNKTAFANLQFVQHYF